MRFLLSTQERSGGTWLQSLLDSHSDICCKGELLNPTTPKHLPPQGNWLSTIYDVPELFAGFRLLDYQNTHFGGSPWRELAADPNLRVIRLIRMDKLGQYVSSQLADTLCKWHFREAQNNGAVVWPRLTIDIDKYLWHLASRAATEQAFAEVFANHAVIRVLYEDLVKDTESVLLQLQEFLGVSPQQLSSTYVQTPSPLIPHSVVNYTELLMSHNNVFVGCNQRGCTHA